MKRIRIVICNHDRQELLFYEQLCRDVSLALQIPAELKTYESGKALLVDLDNPLFKKKLDVVFFTLSAQNDMAAVAAIRETGYAGRIILIGSAQSSIPHETWFDYEVFNFVREGNETEVLNRFAEVFRKAVDAAAKARQEKLVLSYAGDIRQIDIADILYLERQDRGLTVYYGESESFYFISTLAKMENQLQGRNFHRASKAFLICVDAVQQITGTEALLRNGVKIPVGRQYYPALKEAAMQGAASV